MHTRVVVSRHRFFLFSLRRLSVTQTRKVVMALLIAGTFLFSIQRTASARTFSEPQIFTDVPPDSPYFDQTTFMYNAGITTGCTISPPTYASGCATPYLTRAQMAVFIIKALYYRLTGSTTFTYNETP